MIGCPCERIACALGGGATVEPAPPDRSTDTTAAPVRWPFFTSDTLLGGATRHHTYHTDQPQRLARVSSGRSYTAIIFMLRLAPHRRLVAGRPPLQIRGRSISAAPSPKPLVARGELREGRVAVLTLNHPEKRNALSRALLQELDSRLQEVGSNVRVVLLRSTGSVFSSGHDLKELQALDKRGRTEVFELCARVMIRLQQLPQPVVAEVAGLATAAGCQLACAADLVVAADTASFATPGVKVRPLLLHSSLPR